MFTKKNHLMKSEVPTTDSVICLHPILEERGKVKGDDDAYRVSLKDCLACSGCAITEDDINLLAHQDPTLVLEKVREHPGFSALISSSALSNLAAARGWSIQKAYGSLTSFLTSLGASHVDHDGIWQAVWRYLLLDIFNNGNIQKPLIISRCAGAVMFFERKTKYANHLAQIKPFPQLYAIFQKAFVTNSESENNKITYVMNVAPCYDRKLETGRFENDVDAAMTIGEIDDRIIESDEIEVPSFPADNDALYMLRKLSPGKEITTKVIGNTIEYSNGEFNTAMICGEAALRRLCANIDRNRCKFDIVEADFCPNACMAGGGLIRGETPSRRKELVSSTSSIHKENENENENECLIREIVNKLKQQNIAATYVSEEPKKEDFNF
ncbi:hypothetical protein TRFO_10344 [Tritrichomonas foetus]|uniref:Iron hydrogenase large subunit C-terminal domain-containing protein n=1 Tax=Tritrichomonas foetus TaxID=1144522 RepID=A0A1J4J943_9EUKA|nr:hypothetical protein TRFO_10344 [Tritrichomonas foetus]|eukprot:OHS95706.1 hypothetical protein TRFO_10344 [Tritrichomonas foetus]